MTRQREKFHNTALIQALLTLCFVLITNGCPETDLPRTSSLTSRQPTTAPASCVCVAYNLCRDGRKASREVGVLKYKTDDECQESEVMCCSQQKTLLPEYTRTTVAPSTLEYESQEPSSQLILGQTTDPRNSSTGGTGSFAIDYHLPPTKPKPRCGERKYAGNLSNYLAIDDQTDFGEFPWMVAVLKVNNKSGIIHRRFICAGTLIHKRVILTVAHCVKSINSNKLLVRAGDWNLDKDSEEYPYQELEVKQVIVHPNYTFSETFALEEDVALIVTKKAFEYRANVDIVCLPKQTENIEGDKCTAAGWGLLPGSTNVRRKRFSQISQRVFSLQPQYNYHQLFDSNPYLEDFYRLDNYELLAAVRQHLREVAATVNNIGAALDQALAVKKPDGSNQHVNGNSNHPSNGQTDTYSVHHSTVTISSSVYTHSEGDIQGHNSAGSFARPPQNQGSYPSGWNRPASPRPEVPAEPQKPKSAPKILRKVELPIVKRQECEDKMRAFHDGPGRKYMLHESMFCAGGLKGRDTCKGDGGGPLMCPVKGYPDRMVQIGMVAAGFGCGNGVPAMYVNVTRMRTWIDNELDQLGFESDYDY